VVSTVPIPALNEQAASDGRAPAIFARAAAIACQADEAVEVVDAALDHSSHRDRAGGRRITVSTSAKELVQELQKTVDELAGNRRGPVRLNGGQPHAVVTPRADVDPQRYDFAKLGEKIAESLVQSAQQQANAANVVLEQARQLADDIRSQVAEKSRELAEMNERLMDGVALLFALAVRDLLLRGKCLLVDAIAAGAKYK
jgi:hypothetical protein